MKFSRILVFFLLFLMAGPKGRAQSEIENKVIVTLLSHGNRLIPEYQTSKRTGRTKRFNRHKQPPFVLLNVTRSPLEDSEFDTLAMFERKVLLEKDRDLLRDFCEKNQASLSVNFAYEAGSNVTYIRNVELKKLFANKDDWHQYYKKFEQKPLVSVSRPGFNQKKNKALIYLTYSLGKNEGAGYYLVMKKCWGKWKIKGPMLVWVS